MTYVVTDLAIREQIRLAAAAGDWQQAYQGVLDALTDPVTGEVYSGVDLGV